MKQKKALLLAVTTVLMILSVIAVPALDAGAVQGPRDGREPARPRAPQVPLRPPGANDRTAVRPPIADALEGVVANGLQRRLRLSDRQLNNIRPALRESFRRRNELAMETIRLQDELNRAVGEERSGDAIDALVQRLDGANRRLREAREEFFGSIDPELTAEQRARLRSEWPRLEEQVRELIEQASRAR